MMCTKAQLQSISNQIYAEAVKVFGTLLDGVILYGSYARGDYTEDSDIDIMVRVNLPKSQLVSYRRHFSHLGSDLGLEHDVLVSIHLQDNETFQQYRRHLPFYQNVDREGVLIHA